MLASCVADEPAEAPEAIERAAWSTFAFARLAPTGTITAQFSTASTATATIVHSSAGLYTISFPGLGSTLADAGAGGNVQLVSEGLTADRCRIMGWGGTANLFVGVRCTDPDGPLVDAGFAVMFTRNTMDPPTPPVFPAGAQGDTAYAWVTPTGVILSAYSYNSTGVANWAQRIRTGEYEVVFPGLWRGDPEGDRGDWRMANASLILSPYGGVDPGATCSVSTYGLLYHPPQAPVGAGVFVNCHDRLGAPVDTAFSIAVSTSGPSWGQQSAHALVRQPWSAPGASDPGLEIVEGYVDTWGREGACSAGDVTATFGTRGDFMFPNVRITVAGDLGNFWAADPPVQRLSFATPYAVAGPLCRGCTARSRASPPPAHRQRRRA